MVAGKSLAIISLTAQVWHPMGRPSGLARSSRAPTEKRPAAAALVAEYLRNSLLGMAGHGPPLGCGLRRTGRAAYKQNERITGGNRTRAPRRRRPHKPPNPP